MNLTIKPLTPDLTPAYLDFFDNRAFSDSDTNGPCYCTSTMQTTEEIDQMVSEFAGDVKGTIRHHAVKMLGEGKIHGYLAFDGNTSIGWCNAGNMHGYVKNRYQFVPDFALGNAIGKTMSVVCFSVAPKYRGMGVSTVLLERVIADAKTEGYVAVEGYAHIQLDGYNNFKGPSRLYKKFGFAPVAEHNGVIVMRKMLHDPMPLPNELTARLSGYTSTKVHIGCSSAGVYCYEHEDEINYLKIVAIDDEIRREHELLHWLKGKLPVPEVLYYSEQNGHAFLLLTAADGFMTCDCPEDAVHEPIAQIVKLLAEGLLMLQAVDIHDCPFVNTLDCKLKAALYNIEHDLVDMDDFEDGNDFETPMALYQWLTENRPIEELTFTHGDYCLPNIFIDDNAVTGFIDMGRGGSADKWQDIALCVRSLRYNLRGLEEQQRESYVDLLFAHLGIKPDEEKLRYYILLDELF
jgi:aminoglycoside phosphotransferase/GNAT superfamily N-acetyltransferase